MTPQEEKYFEAPVEKRRNFSKQLEDEDYRGIKDVIVEKYSDQAHFICELLQNFCPQIYSSSLTTFCLPSLTRRRRSVA